MRVPARIASFALLTLAITALLQAQVVVGTGTGGNIPANAPAANSGTFTSNAVMNGGGTVASGNAVTITLKGLQHAWSGDLIATLSYLNSQGQVVVSANLFYRIGLTSNQPEGSWVGFGTAGTGDNYIFNTDAPGNIWTVAAALGYADFIPGLQTDTVNNGQYFTSDSGGAKNNLSYAFAGLDIASGTWQLTITDASDHAAEGSSVSNIGSFVGWEIDVKVNSANSDFGLALTPGSQSVIVGNSTSYTVNVSALNGFSGSVSLSATGLPAGASATFTPNPVSVSGTSTTSTMNVTANTTVAAGMYTINVTGQSGALTHTTSATLNVAAAPNGPGALLFIPITPCRVADTRNSNGPFGGP